MKSVYRYTRNGEKTPLRPFTHTALHAPNGRLKHGAHPPKVQRLAISTRRLWRRQSLVGGHLVFRRVLMGGILFGG